MSTSFHVQKQTIHKIKVNSGIVSALALKLATAWHNGGLKRWDLRNPIDSILKVNEHAFKHSVN